MGVGGISEVGQVEGAYEHGEKVDGERDSGVQDTTDLGREGGRRVALMSEWEIKRGKGEGCHDRGKKSAKQVSRLRVDAEQRKEWQGEGGRDHLLG